MQTVSILCLLHFKMKILTVFTQQLFFFLLSNILSFIQLLNVYWVGALIKGTLSHFLLNMESISSLTYFT